MALWAREGDTLDIVVVALLDVASETLAMSGRCWLLGWSVTEATGTGPAVVQMFDGGAAGGRPLDTVELAQSETQRWNPGFPGTPVETELTVSMASGVVNAYLTIGRWVAAH